MLLLPLSQAAAQIAPPDYQECRLESVYPAGGQRGQTVVVEFGGVNRAFDKPLDVLIDWPPGITVRDVKGSAGTARATFEIAPDALPGRRLVRVLNERSGLTNFLYFTVGSLPERVEKEPNNGPASAEEVTLPVVVNGRVNPELDIDCFRFAARKGERIVAAALAHAFDAHGQARDTRGFVDCMLQVLDDRGRVVAEAHDTLGLDPLCEFVAPADGWYTAQVQLLGYQGFPQAVYRLTLGDVPFITSVFPAGGQRGQSVEVELDGPNIPAGTKQRIDVPGDRYPLQFVSLDGLTAGDHDLPFARGDFPEVIETEPNDERQQAVSLELPTTANGRFDQPGDADWYRLRLADNEQVLIETIAQRHLRSPVDTLVQVFDRQGKPVAGNDDASEFDGESPHDFKTFDSRLVLKAPAAGDYFVRVSEQSGSSGPRAVYRLSVSEAQPDFILYQWPDAVPIWGPGSTAAFLVKIERFGGMNEDIELSIEGLPEGWTGSVAYGLGSTFQRPVTNMGLRVFLTITAPPDAPVGAHTTFRVVGRAKLGDQVLQRVAQPLTFYHSGDRGFYRASPVARAVVAAPQGPQLKSSIKELTVRQGQKLEVPVEVLNAGQETKLPVVVNLAFNGTRCNIGSPLTLPIEDGRVTVPVTLGEQLPPGKHGLIISRGWGSDFRVGMPGPCTELIMLQVEGE